MPFYEYRQNNSGGVFTFDAKRGISISVIVEADTARVADAKAQDIGLYFGGFGDCPCCGDRWNAQAYGWSTAGDPEPSHYGTPIGQANLWCSWVPSGTFAAYVHYADGRVVGHGKGTAKRG